MDSEVTGAAPLRQCITHHRFQWGRHTRLWAEAGDALPDIAKSLPHHSPAIAPQTTHLGEICFPATFPKSEIPKLYAGYWGSSALLDKELTVK